VYADVGKAVILHVNQPSEASSLFFFKQLKKREDALNVLLATKIECEISINYTY
jgi:hypothetical protein